MSNQNKFSCLKFDSRRSLQLKRALCLMPIFFFPGVTEVWVDMREIAVQRDTCSPSTTLHPSNFSALYWAAGSWNETGERTGEVQAGTTPASRAEWRGGQCMSQTAEGLVQLFVCKMGIRNAHKCHGGPWRVRCFCLVGILLNTGQDRSLRWIQDSRINADGRVAHHILP